MRYRSNSSRRGARFSGCLAALLFATVLHAQDRTQDRTQWMRDVRWGVMNHYLADWLERGSGLPPLPAGAVAHDSEPMTVERWNDLVDHFNVDGLAMQLNAIGAGYYQISIGQNSGFYLAPNATYDRLTGITPSKCSRRDLVADLSAALAKRGIRLMVYLPAGAPNGDANAKEALQWRNGAFRNREFQEKWQQVIREWSERWGKSVSGWWFDGCYWPNTMYRTDSAPNFATFAAAARAGNPQSALAFNPGVFYRMFSMTPHEDFIAGEIDDPSRFTARRADGGKQDGAQIHVLTFMGARWGMGAPRFSADQAAEFSRKVDEAGGVITWDVPVLNGGLLSGAYLDRLAAVGHALGRISSVPQFQSGLPVNYDESKVGTYTLPDPLRFADGSPVRTAKDWTDRRRAEVFRLFEENVYGRSPDRPKGIKYDVTTVDANTRKVTMLFSGDPNARKVEMLLAFPESRGKPRKPVPLILQLSFDRNDTPAVKADADRVLAHGYGFATIHYTAIEPDNREGVSKGVRSLFLKPGETQPAADEWGALAGWGWALSRAMDHLETLPEVDAKRVAIHGHSRLGKTVLWAAARDTRFAMVYASCSGEGGAALARRDYGETSRHMALSFPYWFCANYRNYAEQIDRLPVDTHELLALIAPRLLYLTDATEDRWADPRGEFLAAVAAEPVFHLLGKRGLETTEMPAPEHPIQHDIGYHVHTGKHEVTPYDWEQVLAFIDAHWKVSGKS
jgi:hypothetical protein